MSGNRLNSDLAEERNRTRRLGSSGILIVRDMAVKIVVPLSASLSEDFCVIYSPQKLPRTGGSPARFR